MSEGKIGRPRSMFALAVMTATASLVVAGIAIASRSTRVSFEFTPNTVPRHEFIPGALHVHLQTDTPPQTRASRIRFDFDNHFRFAPAAFSICDHFEDVPDQIGIDMATAMAQCGPAKVGSGTAQAKSGTTVVKTCVLAFNGPPSHEGLPTLKLFIRADLSPPTVDCSSPRSNHNGDVSLELVGVFRHSPRHGFGRELSFNRMNRVQPFPLTDLDLTLQRGHYVSAHCSPKDAFDGWRLRTKVGYVKPRRVQVVNSTHECFRDRASLDAAGLRE
jgi:hypothetical protein